MNHLIVWTTHWLASQQPNQGAAQAAKGAVERLAEPDWVDIVSPFFAFLVVIVLPCLTALWVIAKTLLARGEDADDQNQPLQTTGNAGRAWWAWSLSMIDQLEEVSARFQAINDQLMRPDLSPKDLMELNKERSQMEPIVTKYDVLKSNMQERDDNEPLLEDDDDEIKSMAKEEILGLNEEIEALEAESNPLLPKDPNDEKNIILEIRAERVATKSLFAGELFQMYWFAGKKGWQVDVMNMSEGTKGGVKEVIAAINGDQVFSHLKYEAGVHRRGGPETETQGRVHTSACTVAIMPEAEEVDIKIDEKDIRVEAGQSGPGGQSVNTTDSAVRITHLPTNMVVQCQDEKSQLKNKNKAMKVLRARLYEKMQAELDAERAEERRSMVKSGDRSEKIRTYNFPQDRCTDHRISLTVHNLPKLFSGELEEVIDLIRAHFQAAMLRGLER